MDQQQEGIINVGSYVGNALIIISLIAGTIYSLQFHLMGGLGIVGFNLAFLLLYSFLQELSKNQTLEILQQNKTCVLEVMGTIANIERNRECLQQEFSDD